MPKPSKNNISRLSNQAMNTCKIIQVYSPISDHEDEELEPFYEETNDKQAPMEIPPSDSRQPPDGHEFPDYVETTSKSTTLFMDTYKPESKECVTNFKTTWSQPVIKPLDRSMSSSNYDLRPKMTDSDEEKYEPVETSNLLHTRSQSLIDMSIFSKEKGASKWNTLMEQRKSRLSKLKGLVIPEAAENDVTPQVNIPVIESITSSQIDLTPKIENNFPQFTKPVSATITPMVLPTWSSNSNLPKYSPAFKRKSLQVYAVSTTKKSDSSDAESSYDEYISKYSDSTPSRTTDDPKSLESIASPTRSDCSFDYTSLKTISVKDHHFHNTKDFADSDNDSAVSSSQSSYNSRSSPPPSPTSEERINAQNRMLKPSSVEAINRKNILASAKCRSGKDIKIGSPVIQRKGSLEEEKQVTTPLALENNNVEEQVQDEKSVFKPEIIEAVVLKEESNNSPLIVNEPAVFEVSVERTNGTTSKFIQKPEEKPIPTKRTHVPVAIKETKPEVAERRFESLVKRHTVSSILEKRNKPVNVQSLKATFENASSHSLPVFPKSYKADGKSSPARTPPELANGKPSVTARRRSEELHLTPRRKPDDKLLFRQTSQEEKPKIETRRLSSSSMTSSRSSITEEQPIKSVRTMVKKEEKVVKTVTNNKETVVVNSSTELRTIELNLNQPEGSLGITLAGGVDYENKNITIHRIKYGSIAYQDGQLKKGDKVVSINGKQTEGLTHSAATDLLKGPNARFMIVIEESRDYVPSSNLSKRISSSVSSLASDAKGLDNDLSSIQVNKKPTNTIKIVTDGAGLGFSIEGGKDSPKGDVPLIVKKIFASGAADKSGELKVGDEILSVNKINFQPLTRIEAWSQMKKIPPGEVTIEIFR